MLYAFKSLWALMLGVWLIIFGSSLHSTLVGFRASLEGFSYHQIGLIFTMNYAGFLLGSLLAQHMVLRVGHVRVFAAMAAISSGSALLQAIIIEPWTWTLCQFIIGACFAIMYVVAESWINDASDNIHRGQIMSSYMVVVLIGKLAGYYLFSAIDPHSFILFSGVSVLISLSVVPMLLSATHSPSFETQEHVSIITLTKISASAVIVVLASQIFIGMFNSLGPVYAHDLDMTPLEVSHFMAFFVLGGLVIQWPIGAISDHFDRRKIIIIACIVSAIAAIIASTSNHHWAIWACVFLLGGFAHPLYSMGVAHANDFLRPSQRVTASASLILLASIGSIIGPAFGSISMDHFGTKGLFIAGFVPFIIMIIWVAWRIYQREPAPEHMRTDLVHISGKATPMAAHFDPETPSSTNVDANTNTDDRTI